MREGKEEKTTREGVREREKKNEMRGWQYGKGLIYLRPMFRLTKLAFLTARATLKKNIIKIPWKDFKTSFIYVFFYKHCLGLNRRTPNGGISKRYGKAVFKIKHVFSDP